jgi:transcriptional regulator with XRE-family HTH domain
MTAFSDIYTLSDAAIVAEMGAFVKHHRLALNKTQSQLAEEAGVSRSTIVDFENGMRANIITLVQLLRALRQMHVLNEFKVKIQPSPIQLAEMDLSKRKRASKSKVKSKKRKSDW